MPAAGRAAAPKAVRFRDWSDNLFYVKGQNQEQAGKNGTSPLSPKSYLTTAELA